MYQFLNVLVISTDAVGGVCTNCTNGRSTSRQKERAALSATTPVLVDGYLYPSETAYRTPPRWCFGPRSWSIPAALCAATAAALCARPRCCTL